jgi:imidazolonepropionase-like amidohydrolase
MRNILFAALFLGLPACLYSQQPTVVLKNVSIIDGTGTPVRRNTDMVISGGVIKSIGQQAPSGAITINMAGKFIMPLINNAHGHLGNVKDTTTAASNYTPANVRHQLQRYLDFGVGAVLSMGTEQPVGVKIRDSSRAGLIPGATMYSAIYGFGVPGALPPESMGFTHIYRPATVEEAVKDVDELAPLKPDVIKIWVDGNPTMKEEIYTAIINEGHKHGIRVAAHVYRLADARKLVAAGIDIFAHSIRDSVIDEAFAEEIKNRNIVYIPTLSLDEFAYIYEDDPEWLRDPYFRAALEPGVYEMVTSPAYKDRLKKNPATERERNALRIAMQNLQILHRAGVMIALGTDSGAMPVRVQGFSELHEMELMVEAGLTPLEAIRAATLNSATLLRAERRTGSLEPGKDASFIVLEDDPSGNIRNIRDHIKAVWARGRKVSTPLGNMVFCQ